MKASAGQPLLQPDQLPQDQHQSDSGLLPVYLSETDQDPIFQQQPVDPSQFFMQTQQQAQQQPVSGLMPNNQPFQAPMLWQPAPDGQFLYQPQHQHQRQFANGSYYSQPVQDPMVEQQQTVQSSSPPQQQPEEAPVHLLSRAYREQKLRNIFLSIKRRLSLDDEPQSGEQQSGQQRFGQQQYDQQQFGQQQCQQQFGQHEFDQQQFDQLFGQQQPPGATSFMPQAVIPSDYVQVTWDVKKKKPKPNQSKAERQKSAEREETMARRMEFSAALGREAAQQVVKLKEEEENAFWMFPPRGRSCRGG